MAHLRRWMTWRIRLVWITILVLAYSSFSSHSLFKLYLPTSRMRALPVDPALPVAANTTTDQQFAIPSTNTAMFNRWHNGSRNTSSTISPQYAIFYNVFIDSRNVTRGVQIIQEQTMQILNKLSYQGRVQHIPLYYNMIGYNYSGQFCHPNMTCVFLNYYEKAFEEVTLQRLHEYCTHNPDHNVYYLHNKGSFSQTYYNDEKRRKLTNNLFRRGHKLLVRHETRNCNVVSAGWEPLPHWHHRGNFWLAKCSYVRELIPPMDFDRARVNMFRRLLQPSKRGKSQWACLRSYFNDSTDDIYQQLEEVQYNVGVGRYNNEMWITSHPDVIPCDTAETVFTSNITFKSMYYQSFAQHEWFRMHGRLFELSQLYGKIPSNSSFFWDYYAATKEPTPRHKCQKA